MWTLKERIWVGMLATVSAIVWMPVPIAGAAEEAVYLSNTIRGRLFDPETGTPMAGATLRFVPIDEEGRRGEAVTAADGSYKVEGLGFGRYALEIETAEGEVIRGVNPFELKSDKYEVTLRVSKRYRSETSVDLEPQRFVVAVTEKPFDWKRFWTEFAIFFGAAVAVGVAAD